jgi:SAM-dependent methyltransferase
VKDNFSRQAGLYARYRPDYPPELIRHLLGAVPGRARAWDCGTGNGQFAALLAPHFGEVAATDISSAQLAHAAQAANIAYSVSPAESAPFPDAHFDLVVAAQALHWFDFDVFYPEVTRVLKPDGRFAAAGYGRCRLGGGLDPALLKFYTDVIGPYWDAERRHVDERYRTIPFPFREIPAPEFIAVRRWTIAEFLGYVSTWSAVQHYIRERGSDPLDLLRDALAPGWPPSGALDVQFSFFLRIGAVDGR